MAQGPGTSPRLRTVALLLALLAGLGACTEDPVTSTEAPGPTPTERSSAPAVAPPQPRAPAATLRPRPNIVFVMVDDMRADDLRFMPATRRLVGGAGVEFVNSFAPFPLCCPARASALTGLYAHNHRVYDVKVPWAFPSFRDRSTLATWLDDAGYATTFVGKYLNGYGYLPEPGADSGSSVGYVPPGWDDWRASLDGGLPWWHLQYGSTYEYFDTTLSANGEGFVNYEGRYQTSVYGELAEQIVTQRAPSANPFFLYLSFTAPHHGEPFEADDPGLVTSDDGTVVELVSPARPDRVKGRFDHVVTEAPGARWDDPDFTDKPAYLRRLAPLNDGEKAAMLEVTRQRAESLWVVDEQVRRLVRALRRTGELDDTVVVFTSDNGYFLGEQRMRQGKTFPHDPSLRVPLLMRGPGIPAGEERTDPFTSIDVAPTLAELAGITPGHPVDGVSLVRVARDGDRGWRRGVLTETGPRFSIVRATDERGRPMRPGRKPDIRFAIGVRTDRYLYVDVASGGKELYDLARDPRQYRNLARAPRYADVRRRLARVLEDLRACDGPACRAPLPASLATRP